jgi:hypothetical protein
MLKLGHGSTPAALAMALAPYALWALLLSVFVIGYIAALAQCLCRTRDQEAMERIIMVSACAVVSILTLTAPTIPARRPPAARVGLPPAASAEPPGPRSGEAG